MKALRAQRVLMGLILLAGLLLYRSGHEWGEYIIWFVALMSIFSAIINFCPSEWFFRKIFKE
ncbi:MAG TPA: DUF2892 domain-containing protein [Thermosulfurimonas dismutans]|uniref:DUF2892 domain-containing protein n=1 Tax=Thermosulfurimonas dismutans TaxID=999894 RepID=A0A7C3GFW6_9BACT|nr:DUF2892 domain-containing protein [Thermosulfurimonas dismutans]